MNVYRTNLKSVKIALPVPEIIAIEVLSGSFYFFTD